jgi:long-chain acyl-CoA synthetase
MTQNIVSTIMVNYKAKRLFDIWDNLIANYPKDNFLNNKEDGNWVGINTQEAYDKIYNLASGLINLDLKAGDKVAIMSHNCLEWVLADYACQIAGIITIPLFPTFSAEDLKFVINDSEVKAIFVGSKGLMKKVFEIEEHIPNVRHFYTFLPVENAKHYNELIEDGKKNSRKDEIEKRKAAIDTHDVVTILYTSGTTGTPKGVMISHYNLAENVYEARNFAPFETSWKVMCVLPLNHVYERMLVTLYLTQALTIYFVEAPEKVGDYLREVKPQVVALVPRIIEKVYDRIMSRGAQLTGFKKKLFYWAVDLANDYTPWESNGFIKDLKMKIARKLIFSKWQEALGGNIYCIVSGGAALQARLNRLFNSAGILILEGYGLTETAVVISVNSLNKPKGFRIGTVGTLFDGIDLKFAEDGEICIKSPSVMKGYYKRQDLTDEVIDKEGWFHTGDIGVLEDGNYLKITDRKKEIFKTSSGKYIAPLVLENRLKEIPLLENVMVIGEKEKYPSALIVPNSEALAAWCKENRISGTCIDDYLMSDAVKKYYKDFINKINKTLAPYEQIRKFELLKAEWSVDGGELSPKLSLKRKVIMAKYKAAVDKIYGAADDE